MLLICSGPGTNKSVHNEAEHTLDVVHQQISFMDCCLNQALTHETPGHPLSSEFMNNLYERSSGSHETFFGHTGKTKVKCQVNLPLAHIIVTILMRLHISAPIHLFLAK